MVHPERWVFHTMPHPRPHIWVHPHDQSLQLLCLYLLQCSRVIQIEEILMIHILHGDVRPTFRPLAQRLFSSSLSMWTSMASPLTIATCSGDIWSIGNPGIHRVALLGVWGGQLMASSRKDNAGPS